MSQEVVVQGLDNVETRPYLIDFKFGPDNKKNSAIENEHVTITSPNLDREDCVSRRFFEADGIRYHLYGTVFRFDLICTAEFLTGVSDGIGKDRPLRFSQEYLDEWNDKLFKNRRITLDEGTRVFGYWMMRMERTAKFDHDPDTIQALDLLYAIAKRNGTIAVVEAHGGKTFLGPRHPEGELWLYGHSEIGTGFSARETVKALSERRNTSGMVKYDAIYVGGCNKFNLPIDMGTIEHPIPIPVIAHRAVSTIFGSPVKVYWPLES